MPTFTAGLNIAMKIPSADFDATVTFYRDVLGFDVTEEDPGTPSISRSCAVRFGPNTLWLDRADDAARSDLWLQLRTDDVEAATARLAEAGIGTCDEMEQLSDPNAHWIKNPAGVVHLLMGDRDPG